MAEDWRRIKNPPGGRKAWIRSPRRERVQPRPLREGHLVAQGQDTGAHPPLQLEKAVGVGRCRLLPPGRRRLARVRDVPGSYDEESLVEFLGQLHGHLGGDKVTIIWDGLPSHRSKLMKAYVASQRRLGWWSNACPPMRPTSTPSSSSGGT